MAVTGFLLPTTEAALNTTGSWGTIANIRLKDGVFVIPVVTSFTTLAQNVLEARNFGISTSVVPNGSTITKVELRATWKRPSTATTVDCDIQAFVSGAAVGSPNVATVGATLADDTYDITAARAWAPADFRDGVLTARIRCENGGASNTNGFNFDSCQFQVTFTPPAPTVTSVSPDRGVPGGSTSVTITGTNLDGASAVTFGGSSATSVVPVNSTTVTCTTPAHAPGFVDVVVTATGGNGTGTNAYSYNQTGTLAATEGADVVAITGSLGVRGTLAATEAADVAAFEGEITDNEVTGELDATEEPDVVEFTVEVISHGILDATEEPDVVEFAGTVVNYGVLDVTEGSDVVEFIGEVIVQGELDVTEDEDVVSFTGFVAWTLVLDATEEPDVAAFEGELSYHGILDATEGADVAAFTGELTIVGELAVTEEPDIASFFGETAIVQGELAAIEDADTIEFEVNVYTAIVLAAIEGEDIAEFNGELIALPIFPEIETIDGMARRETLAGISNRQILTGRANSAALSGREAS